MKVPTLLIVLAAAMTGCAAGAVRTDQAQVRELRSGTSIVLSVVDDPADHVRCWIAYSGLWCREAR